MTRANKCNISINIWFHFEKTTNLKFNDSKNGVWYSENILHFKVS